MPDTESYIQSLILAQPMRAPVLRSAIAALQLPTGSHGLDIGCGIGLPALLLAEAVGPSGHVTGMDISPPLLARAREIADQAGLAARLSFQQGDMHRLPLDFEDDALDWVWSADCVGYANPAPMALLQELRRIVKPGGCVALLIWSSQTLLPGYPFLEARLNATATGVAPFRAGMAPTSHYLRALGWLREAGFKAPHARAFAGSVHAPLRDEIRDALADLFQMRWGTARSEVAPEDWTTYRRLCQPDSPDFILNLPDYYAFFNYSLFWGQVV
jgi:ubiquinone/menaquinone biosynthesis C-methylase UbiE